MYYAFVLTHRGVGAFKQDNRFLYYWAGFVRAASVHLVAALFVSLCPARHLSCVSSWS